MKYVDKLQDADINSGIAIVKGKLSFLAIDTLVSENAIITELSRAKLANYIRAASANQRSNQWALLDKDKCHDKDIEGEVEPDDKKKVKIIRKRREGLDAAVRKIVKEDITESDLEKFSKFMVGVDNLNSDVAEKYLNLSSD